MKQRQQVRHGEPTPGELFAGLAKMLWQGRSIGHGKTRAIDPKGAMAQPAPLIKGCLLQSVAHGAELLLEYREGELHARLTIGGSRHIELGEMTQVRARGIAVQNLDKKQLDRGHGIERTLPPPMGDATTGGQDGIRLQLACPVLLKLFDYLGECRRHGGSPLCVSEQLTPHTGDRHGGQ
jgi:hypothetical protein